MIVSTKDYPEFLPLLNKASGDSKMNECAIEVFPLTGMDLDSNWSGGTKYFYTLLNLQTHERMIIPDNGNIGQPNRISLESVPVNFCLVEKVIFQGKKMSPRIYLNETNFTKLLPQPSVELSIEEANFLKEYRSLKSSYRPKNNTLLNSLKEKGLIAANNSVTTSGKNWGR